MAAAVCSTQAEAVGGCNTHWGGGSTGGGGQLQWAGVQLGWDGGSTGRGGKEQWVGEGSSCRWKGSTIGGGAAPVGGGTAQVESRGGNCWRRSPGRASQNLRRMAAGKRGRSREGGRKQESGDAEGMGQHSSYGGRQRRWREAAAVEGGEYSGRNQQHWWKAAAVEENSSLKRRCTTTQSEWTPSDSVSDAV